MPSTQDKPNSAHVTVTASNVLETVERQKQLDLLISQSLKHLAKEQDKTYKILLFGANRSGKSTIYRQFQILFSRQQQRLDHEQFRDVIHRNVMLGMVILLEQAEEFGFELENESEAMALLEQLNQILDSEPEKNNSKGNSNESDSRNEQLLKPELGERLEKLWNDKGIQNVYERRTEFPMVASLPYFMKEIARISSVDYIPNNEDVLRCHQRTESIMELLFSIQHVKFHVVDVSGQENERRKLYRMFGAESAILFVVDISEYVRYHCNDCGSTSTSTGNTTNGLLEGIQMFEEITSIKYLKGLPIVVVLNKKDLFEQNINHIDMKCFFPDYTGGCNYDAAINYLKNLFLNLNKDESRYVTVVETCSIDSDMVKQTVVNNLFKAIQIFHLEQIKQHNTTSEKVL
jgi:guanine nucleotide-binding protein G(i) subunit alpha